MRIWKLVILAGLMVTTIYAGKAQNPKQANIWYFGYYAGLDFTNGNPVALTNGAMWASEGSSVVNGPEGNLLFYTNGGEYSSQTGAIWNRNHQIMPNGYLGTTGGCASSIQSAIGLKKPGSLSIYYLFSTDCAENGLEKGLTYSIIDMSLDGGLGDVTIKGHLLDGEMNESLTAVVHANQKDYWVITHRANTDSFFVYHFNNTGIEGVVKSKVGPVTNDYAGEIKVSANGTRLAYCGTSFTGLFDFNPETGVISNYRNLNVGAFTASFSPNCELLYTVDFSNRKIYQFDVIAYNVSSTKTEVGSSATRIGSLQMGPDGKIYVAMRNSQYVGMIIRPNIKGLDCNFVENGVHLSGKFSNYGLPNFANNILGECQSYPEENTSKYNHAQFLIEQIGANHLVLGWNSSPGASEYRLSQRKVESNWETLTVSANQFVAENLSASSEYEFRIDAIVYQNAIHEFIYNHDYEEVMNQGKTEDAGFIRVKTAGEMNFSVFPNPAKENTSVEFFMTENSSTEILLSDVNGKVLIRERIAGRKGLQQVQLPLSQIQNGIYHVSVKNDGVTSNKKLVIMN